jgi:tRNA pseudouridine38-40 synthase
VAKPPATCIACKQAPSLSHVDMKNSRRWKCICAYDGTGFTGWQSQAGGRAVQDVIEARLAEIFEMPVRIYGSGRTDAGVHARGQVFHFDAGWPHGADRLCKALRCGLPGAIQIRSARVVVADFHSRVQATRKRYVYHVQLGEADPFTKPFCVEMLRPLDFAGMEAAAAELRGKHDFRAFTALNGTERENTVRTVSRLELTRRGRRLRITAEAEGFLYKMVRSLVGALLAVGEGRLTPEQVKDILESKARTALVKTAPPQGLFLDRVFYS